ncbi:hypothetical protein MKY59_21660 [Paenibacillus sp. FSL W8-0426]|uniref:hypothetical protein n=1 Tax=Paenibacillus sp. FSL W8-0426 TaxID=2921714 RepID=UPI0030DBDE3B
MNRALTINIRSSNNEVSRILNNFHTQPSRFIDVMYNGGVREYEDAADYVDARVLKGRVIA